MVLGDEKPFAPRDIGGKRLGLHFVRELRDDIPVVWTKNPLHGLLEIRSPRRRNDDDFKGFVAGLSDPVAQETDVAASVLKRLGNEDRDRRLRLV